MKNYKKLMRMNNAVDPALSSTCWGKSPYKRYPGVAGKSGNTTNFEIKEQKEG